MRCHPASSLTDVLLGRIPNMLCWGLAVLLPPPPPGLLGLPLKLLRGQPHVSRSGAALVETMHKLQLTTG